jgi:mannose-6-phosphate isomerase-like protein (cupin superfamily)
MLVSSRYAELVEKACWSHAHGRNLSQISQADIEAARLFSYAYRAQTIGAFHATRVALASHAIDAPNSAKAPIEQAGWLLEQLVSRAIDPIHPSCLALISTLYVYHQWTSRIIELLAEACMHCADSGLETIHYLFFESIQKLRSCDGIYVARDLELPLQGAFTVPGLDISIVPIIYGDHHSWNAAFLAMDQPGVAVHRHHHGAEIHLGFASVEGRTILGKSFSVVNEGYAMPIPPMTDHGFINTSGHDHILPFVFGSLKMGGWGIFFDVEPCPGHESERIEQPLQSEAMNQSVPLERVIERVRIGRGYHREVLVFAERAGAAEIGGLELAITRAGPSPIDLCTDSYRIVSLQSGSGLIRMGGTEKVVGAHDHFGIPSGMECLLTPQGHEPLLFLDCRILPL